MQADISQEIEKIKLNFKHKKWEKICDQSAEWNVLNYLILETLNTISDLQYIIKYVNNFNIVEKKYNFFSKNLITSLDNYTNNILKIKDKLADNHFLVGVFGEFSAGKSTFINALTEHPFLVESTVGGTTCVPTYLEYAEKENVHVYYNSGKVISFIARTFLKGVLDTSSNIFSTIKDIFTKKKKVSSAFSEIKDLVVDPKEEVIDQTALQAFIQSFTTDEEQGKEIQKVVWESSVPVLERGLSIVDTPGIATGVLTNSRHADVAKKVAAECDVLLVITSLAAPLSEELLNSVELVAGARADRCIFVGTRVDQLHSAKELERQSMFFEKRLLSRFNAKKKYYFVSAYLALQELESQSSVHTELDRFRDFRKQIVEFLINQRQIIQCDNIAAQIAKILQQLSAEIQQNQNFFQDKINEFKTKVLQDDNNFWKDLICDTKFDFEDSIKYILPSVEQKADSILDNLKFDVEEKIYKCNNLESLKHYLSTDIKNTISKYIKILYALIQNDMIKSMEIVAENSLKKLKPVITKKYNELEGILGKVKIDKMTIDDDKDNPRLEVSYLDNREWVISLGNDSNFRLGGGLAGLGISFLIPGAGLLVGGALAIFGSIIGSLFVDLHDRKKEACAHFKDFLDQMRGKVMMQLLKINNDFSKAYSENLKQVIKKQQRLYTKTVDRYNQEIIYTSNFLETINERLLQESLLHLGSVQEKVCLLGKRIAAKIEF